MKNISDEYSGDLIIFQPPLAVTSLRKLERMILSEYFVNQRQVSCELESNQFVTGIVQVLSVLQRYQDVVSCMYQGKYEIAKLIFC